MIGLRPFDNLSAHAVLSRLDACDRQEAELARGAQIDSLDLFADWRAMQQVALLSFVVFDRVEGGAPFATLMVIPTPTSGIAQAAFLARDHARFRAPLMTVARQIRRELPEFCARTGIFRVECRCWSDHRSARRFLRFCGFRRECQVPGYGPDGETVFEQYSFLQPLSPLPEGN